VRRLRGARPQPTVAAKGYLVFSGVYNVQFLCTGNSARNVMAVLNQLGAGIFRGYSAGSQPAGAVNACTLELLQRHRFRTDGLRQRHSGQALAGLA